MLVLPRRYLERILFLYTWKWFIQSSFVLCLESSGSNEPSSFHLLRSWNFWIGSMNIKNSWINLASKTTEFQMASLHSKTLTKEKSICRCILLYTIFFLKNKRQRLRKVKERKMNTIHLLLNRFLKFSTLPLTYCYQRKSKSSTLSSFLLCMRFSCSIYRLYINSSILILILAMNSSLLSLIILICSLIKFRCFYKDW